MLSYLSSGLTGSQLGRLFTEFTSTGAEAAQRSPRPGIRHSPPERAASVCALTFELSRPWRQGSPADRGNMLLRPWRPGCLAGAGRLERRVRPQPRIRCKTLAVRLPAPTSCLARGPTRGAAATETTSAAQNAMEGATVFRRRRAPLSLPRRRADSWSDPGRCLARGPARGWKARQSSGAGGALRIDCPQFSRSRRRAQAERFCPRKLPLDR